MRPYRPGWPWAAPLACARKAHKVEDNGGDEACSGAPQAARLTTLVTLRPLLGVSYPWYQISFLALGRCSTSASCSSLVEEVRPASSARGRGCRWTGQPRLSNRDVGASTGRAYVYYKAGLAGQWPFLRVFSAIGRRMAQQRWPMAERLARRSSTLHFSIWPRYERSAVVMNYMLCCL